MSGMGTVMVRYYRYGTVDTGITYTGDVRISRPGTGDLGPEHARCEGQAPEPRARDGRAPNMEAGHRAPLHFFVCVHNS